MHETKGLRTLEEWDRLAAVGKVREPIYKADAPNTGIECPDYNSLSGGLCRSHLYDLPFFDIDDETEEKRRYVCCRTCGWVGSRRIAEVNDGEGF